MKVTLKGMPLELEGTQVEVGQRAPDVKLVKTDLSVVGLDDFKGNVLILASVPSLDTPVCDMEARRFNEEATKLSQDIKVLIISMDLPFAQKRWCGASGVDTEKGGVITLSDHRLASFGMNYGVLIKDLRLLARAIFVVSKDGIIKHKEIVSEITNEPNYEAALEAARACL
ncbi:MAG: thiol peroxidase [Syntrophobacterales bacterium]|nr:thiol peroxidase [Syntrophobacterales bacterium]